MHNKRKAPVLRPVPFLRNSLGRGMTSEIWVTIHDIQKHVPISARTIRAWTALGLMPKPVLVSEGYKCGVQGLYPEVAISVASTLYALRYMSLADRGQVMRSKRNYRYTIEDDGTLTVTVPIKRANKGKRE